MPDSQASQSPSGVGIKNSGVFGLNHNKTNARCVLIPVPWDATTSYMAGTHKGPQSIYESSPQLDLYHPDFPNLCEEGVFMHEGEQWITQENTVTRQKVESIIHRLEQGKELSTPLQEAQQSVNASSNKITAWLKEKSHSHIKQQQIVGVVGGDHSTPLGLMQALAEEHESFGILHIDAHHDYRNAYMGFSESHASIMYNAAKIKNISHFVQVGIRDYCEEEVAFTQQNKSRFITFYDQALKEQSFQGKNWHDQCQKIISKLPAKTYISFDIDGLAPHLCPSTGTPVPGGLSFEEVLYLIKLASRHSQIIGFDLVEVGGETDSIDAIVGARLLWHLCGYASTSRTAEK